MSLKKIRLVLKKISPDNPSPAPNASEAGSLYFFRFKKIKNKANSGKRTPK
jgi:hypothetical protein